MFPVASYVFMIVHTNTYNKPYCIVPEKALPYQGFFILFLSIPIWRRRTGVAVTRLLPTKRMMRPMTAMPISRSKPAGKSILVRSVPDRMLLDATVRA